MVAHCRKRQAIKEPVIWEANPGAQKLFMKCPIFEALIEGNRGGGKTDVLLMDFGQFVGKGYGAAWRGILFRETYPQLEEVINKSFKWFRRIWPRARYNGGNHCWRWPGGEALYFRHARRHEDYYDYHGHEYPWVGWEELTNWPDDVLYMDMMSVCRSSAPGIPRHYRSTCNPYGVGHHWVKGRFIDIGPPNTICLDPKMNEKRVRIHSSREECLQLLENDPNYLRRLMTGGPKENAWLTGDWDIVAGGMFDDVWNKKVHVIEPFEIPESWYVDRSFDWGSSAPYSAGWWAESDGSIVKYPDGRVFPTRRGDLFRVKELYGWTGKPNEGTRELAAEVARKIKEIDGRFKVRVRPGPADPSIYANVNNNCIADDMAHEGVSWVKAYAEAGSRVNGWEILRKLLKSTVEPSLGLPRLFIFDRCRQFIRTVPVLPRDDRDMDDVNTNTEDHVGDEARYRCLAKKHLIRIDSW